jgi:uncharacterized protein YdaU (DUF1376 family)
VKLKKIKYVQLEPNAFLSDSDFQAMTAAERGVYWTLVLYLYCNNGRLKLDFAQLGLLCACENFEQIWLRIKKKFSVRGGMLRHKRVTKELKRAKEFMEVRRQAGLKGADKRWHSHSKAIATKSKGNVIEKESKDTSNTNTVKSVFSSSSSFRLRSLQFHEALIGIIKPRSQSDRTCFRNVANWLVEGLGRGKFNEQIFDRVLDYAREAKKGRNPAAVFMALLKKELDYK